MKRYIKVNGKYIEATDQQATNYLISSFIRDDRRWAIGFFIIFLVIFAITLAQN